MLRDRIFSLTDPQQPTAPGCAKLDVAIPIPGGTLETSLHVADTAATLVDIVPVARQMGARLASARLESLRANGSQVSCRKGCAACCRYLVPLSVPEAFALWDEIHSLPEPQHERVMVPYLHMARAILNAVPAMQDSLAGEFVEAISRWYGPMDLDCPFLAGELCSIYQQRPIACREYMITGDASRCSGEGPGHAEVVPLPVSVAEALMELAAEVEGTEPQALLLPLALLWAHDHPDRARRTWPARELAERLVTILTGQRAAIGATTEAA